MTAPMRPLSEPVRFKDSTDDDIARALFAAGRPTAPLPPSARFRGERRVAKLATMPVVILGVGLWSKVVAAAFGVGFASALALVSVSPAIRERLTDGKPKHHDERPKPARVAKRELSAFSTLTPAPTASVEEEAPPAITEPRLASEPERRVATLTPVQRGATRPVSPSPHAADIPAATAAFADPAPAISASPPDETKPFIDDSMPAEVRMLSHARLLVTTAPVEALELLGQHAAMFPKASLALEREVLTVEALQNAGRTAEARARAERLLQASPGALYAARLERMLAPAPK